MDWSQITPIGAMFVITMSLMELVKFLLGKRKKPNGCNGLTAKERDALFGTYRILKEQVVGAQKEMAKTAQDMNLNLALMRQSMERIEKKSLPPMR